MTDISTHYGGSVLALKGARSTLIISDTRLGDGNITKSCNFQRVFQITPQGFVGFTMFAPDGQIMIKDIKRESKLFELANGRNMSVNELSNCVSHYLYKHRTSPRYVEPIIAGIDVNGLPFISGQDCLGCPAEYSFVASGTAEKNLIGLAEALFTENMDDTDLFTTGMQIFLNAIDRDALSGWGAVAYLIGQESVTRREVKSRMD